MDLIQLKHYLRSRKITPLLDAANHFQVDADTIRPLVEIWIEKGKVRRYPDRDSHCGGCCKCCPSIGEFFEWLD
ncbi:MAG: FeoC-like transcriptional regulator [Desulfobulbus sp.]